MDLLLLTVYFLGAVTLGFLLGAAYAAWSVPRILSKMSVAELKQVATKVYSIKEARKK